jgi:7-cyano-7-deazaguanine synthase in queuosine biosynthesis
MAEAVLLNSGGIDSRVVAHMMHEKGWELHSLHVPWNAHNRDASIEAAQRTADRYCKGHLVANQPNDWVLGKDGTPVGLTHTEGYMHILAATYAHHLGAEYVVSGLHQDAVTGDWRRAFLDLLGAAKMRKPPVFVFPLYDSEDWDAGARRAKELGLDVSDTVSCWQYPPCGECQKCHIRKEYGIDG